MSGRTRFAETTDSARAVVCPLDLAIRVIGGKWKMLILRSLFVDGAQRYNSLLRTVPGISAKELTRNLQELEHASMIARGSSEGEGSDIKIYALTDLGSRLQPAFKALGAFGELLLEKRKVGTS
jgi:DNA-binding HxlR family transcriptional regulator